MERGRTKQGNIPVEDEEMAGETLEMLASADDGVARPELRLLECVGQTPIGVGGLDRIGLMSHHHDRLLHPETGRGVEYMGEQRLPVPDQAEATRDSFASRSLCSVRPARISMLADTRWAMNAAASE